MHTKWQDQSIEKSGFKKTSCIVFLIILIGIATWFFFFSSFFNIKTIIIEGSSSSQKKDIEKIIKEKTISKKNLFSFPSNKTEKELKNQFKNLAEAQIYKGPPDALRVIVIERKPMLLWQIADNNYVIDNYGIAYRKADDKDKKLPQIIDERADDVKIGDKVLSTAFLGFIGDLSKTFSQNLNTKISKIVVKDSVYEVMIYTDKNQYFIFDTSGSLTQQISDAKVAFEKIGNNKIEYFDLRVPGKVYYK